MAATNSLLDQELLDAMNDLSDANERIQTHHNRFKLTHDRMIEDLNQLALLICAYQGLLDADYTEQMSLLVSDIGSLLKQNGEALECLGHDFQSVINTTMELFGIETFNNNTLAE